MLRYIISESKLNIDDAEVDTYGITAYCGKTALKTIDDISTDRNFVISLIEKLNFHQVELCHFYDIVIDELNR